ncbi:MAG: sigma-54 dependent transcriptional regulator [Bdellovibrionales bacterium]|nr:sigma-54 dependent transcriptional regulator [Bdellovibrionales bacterium]
MWSIRMRDKILVIDDETNLRKILEATLIRAGYEVLSHEGFDSAKLSLNTEAVDVVITDLQMPGASGMDVLNYCKQYAPDLPVVMITAFGTIEKAVAAMQAGAFDFVLKPFQNEELFRIIEKAIQSRIRRRREPATEMMSAVGVGAVPIPLFGRSEEAVAFRAEVERISKSAGPVLMTGEIGTGKRSVAREIHRKSDRSRGPFIQINLDAIPPVFQEAELFGVEKGATPLSFFTKPGAFELAQGGILFLEEIDSLSIEAQNRFFVALEMEYFTRTGGVNRIPMEFRIIATSSRDPGVAFREGSFHIELQQRLSTEILGFAPLRNRREDLISDFIPYFIEKASRVRGIPAPKCSETVLQELSAREWRGNLGELERVITRAINRCDGNILDLHFFSPPGG